jgi:hypothetical protein
LIWINARRVAVGVLSTHKVPLKSSSETNDQKRAVLSEYDRWAKKHPKDASMMGGFLFFRYLQEERSDLLDFRAVGNK